MSKVLIAGVDTSTLPKMTNADQLACLLRIKGGDGQSRSDFIFANMRLVLSVIQKYINKKTNQIDDVFQVGCVGLIKAIDNFDPKYGVMFSTYAVPMNIRCRKTSCRNCGYRLGDGGEVVKLVINVNFVTGEYDFFNADLQ